MVTYRFFEYVACCICASDTGVRSISAAGVEEGEFLENSISGRDSDEELIVSLTLSSLDRH